MVIEFEQLNPLQRQAIEEYSKTVCYSMNIDLRQDRFPLWWDMFHNEERTKIIDSIFSLTPTKSNPPILYRGTQNIDLYNNPEFTEKGFMSTSLNESIAQKHIHKENGAVLKIHLQDSNIHILEVESQFNESEYLLSRNTNFKVLYRVEETNPLTNQIVLVVGVCPLIAF
jgi:hypothetical protein